MAGTDGSGAAGIEGEVDRHWGAMAGAIGGTALFTVLGQAGAILRGDGGNTNIGVVGAEAWAAVAARAPHLNYVSRATRGCFAGEIVGAGGVIPDLKPRATAWFMIEPLLPERALVEARRKCREVIAAAHLLGYRRIEAHVHERFPRGCRFAERLGFVLEGYHPYWLPDGAGVFSFARFDPPLPEGACL
jgi:hypothetical protein